MKSLMLVVLAALAIAACGGSPSTQISEVDGMELVYVPAGSFMMGSEDGDEDEKPVHELHLDAYWIDRTEVTNAMFERFVDATGHDAGSDWRNEASGKADHPVVSVNWHDAKAYCEWAGRRLPTEAEWEKAARGTDGRVYPWGDAAPAGHLLNFADKRSGLDWADTAVDDGYERTAPVGSYPAGASPYGAADMAGNVWEWCADWYDENYYAVSPKDNPQGPATGEYRVVRGGSWYSTVGNVRAANRAWFTPDRRSGYSGFRCARSPSS